MKVAFVVYPDFTALDLVRRLARKMMLGDRPARAAANFGREMMRARLRRARGVA